LAAESAIRATNPLLPAPSARAGLQLSELLSALSHALDLGCSSNAARICQLYLTDDLTFKRDFKTVGDSAPQLLRFVAGHTGPAAGLIERFRTLLSVVQRSGQIANEVIAARCERGAGIARKLRFPERVADGIASLDEHWNGGGQPMGAKGAEIPLYSQIALMAQVVDVFNTSAGRDAARQELRRRSGTWFDPALVKLVQRWKNNAAWWSLLDGDIAQAVVAAEPKDRVVNVDADGLDVVCRAFADIIDAKSPFTYRHSTRVADVAREVARHCGLDEAEQRRIYRAGLLHDIGKLGISNTILDKNGPMTPEERSLMEMHPRFSLQILERVSAFRRFAWTAALHHEKLDGTGYPFGASGDSLDLPARILVVSDIYDALTSDRPYRAGMTEEQASAILDRERGTKLCPRALDGLAKVRASVASRA